MVSDLKKERAKEERLRSENRRLREQMRKDRMIADRRHRQINSRIGAHDQVQGIDTAPREDDGLLGYEAEDNPYAYDDDEPSPRRRPRSRSV